MKFPHKFAMQAAGPILNDQSKAESMMVATNMKR